MAQQKRDDLKVLYYDYLGFEHRGTIVLTQPCEAPDVEPADEENAVAYLYINDDKPEFNDKVYDKDGIRISYAEIRRSDECIPCYDGSELE